MITRKELEKMIENGEVFYCEFSYKTPTGLSYGMVPSTHLVFSRKYRLDNEELVVYDLNHGQWQIKLTDIYKDENDTRAGWRANHCEQRIERFEPPHWSVIEQYIERMKKFGLNHSDRVLGRIITRDNIYYLKLVKDFNLFTIELKQTYIGDDLYEQMTVKFPKILGKATKENYEKAVDFARKLFLEEVEK